MRDMVGSTRDARAIARHTGLLLTHGTHPTTMFSLHYFISKRTPPSPKALEAILAVQAEINRRCTWTFERLNLAPERSSQRPALTFPLFRIGTARPFPPGVTDRSPETASSTSMGDASVSGSTRVRDNLWNGHLVVGFLKSVSHDHPELLFELRDELGGFVLPGAVWIKNGNVELQRDWLNRERERALEATGDPQAAAPYVWAEAEALQGRFFQNAPASEYAEVPEIRESDISWDQLRSMTLEDVAEIVVDRVTSSREVSVTV
jgi:hypothetical protein